jgi:predicted protein tyrosine phosphatase
MKEMTIEVFSRQAVEKFITDLPHIVISIREPGSAQPKLPENSNRIAELYIECDDIDIDSPMVKQFAKDDAKAILGLLKVTLPYINTIVVHCEAGQSRSAGVGAALSIILRVPDGDKKYFNPRGPYYPNRYIYRTMLNTALEENWYLPEKD